MKLRTHLVLVLSLCAVLFAGWAFLVAGRSFLKTDISIQEAQLEHGASFLSSEISLHGLDDSYLDSYATLHEVRLTVIGQDGSILYDNEDNPETMDNHLYREEIKEAVAHGIGKTIRHSHTLKTDMLYVAKSQGNLVIRLSAPISSLDVWKKNFISLFLPTLIPFLCVLMVLCILYLSHLLRPLSQLSEAATIWSKGKLNHQLLPEGSP